MSDSAEEGKSGSKRFLDRIGVLVGTVGSIVTIVLTLWNAQTKHEIDKRQEELQELELQLKERTTGVEESKERVERYKWVLTLLPSLTEQDANKRNFTVALVRLALTKEEAEQLFAGLQQSASEEVRMAARQGIEAIETQELARLVSQINADSADVRKRAVAALERDYSSSSTAITSVIELYGPERFATLSPSGAINGLYYLSNTDPQAWTPDNLKDARTAIARVRERGAGPQTAAAIETAEKLIRSVEAQQSGAANRPQEQTR